jgi:D-alanyl-D-alanine carboxypeptidase
VIDMSAYARMLLARGSGPASRLLSEGSFAAMTGRHIEDQDDRGWFYGYGLWTGHADGRNHIEHSGGMVGYTAYLSLDPDGGLGTIMCLNGSGERAPAVGFALDVVRAAIAGEALPDPEPAPDPLRIPDAAAFAGHYRGAARDIDVLLEGEGLRFRDEDIDVALELDLCDRPQDALLVPHPERDRYYLRFGRDASGEVVEASHGPDWFAGRRSGGPTEFAAPPRKWRGFVGHYRNYNPWMPGFRVVLRKGSLVLITSWVDEVMDLELVALSDGSFRVGTEDWRPGRIRFDTVVEGRALRAHYDDGTWYRSFLQ